MTLGKSTWRESGQVSFRVLAALALLVAGLARWSSVPSPPPADSGRARQVASQGEAAAPTVKGTPLLLFPAPSLVSGEKLPATPWRTVSSTPERTTGREAVLDQSVKRAIPRLRAADPVELPLLDGIVARGHVNLIQHGRGGWLRVGGSLDAPHGGAFSLATDGTTVAGLIQFPSRDLAFEIVDDPKRGLILRERRLSDVLCLPLPRPNFEPTPSTSGTETPATSVPLYSSRPEVEAVLYLDFDGETVTDPSWNSGRTIVAKAPNVSPAAIEQICQRVAEDFSPFNVDVTTDLSRYTNAPVGRRMRCIITPTDTASPGAGGVAYIDSFAKAGTARFSDTIPCWVFNVSVTGIAEAVTHELGHTLGLRHDGRTSPSQEYYPGHGVGSTSWAPIMGVGYSKTVVQWSKGEYLFSNNKQDDVAIIAANANGFGYVADEAGGTPGTAAALSTDGSTVNQTGVISSATDHDVYTFTCGPGTVDLAADPAPLSPNLDIILELLDSRGDVLLANNPADRLNAALFTTIPGGTYYVRIRGTGKGDPLNTGYSTYGSIGTYTIHGSIPMGTPVPVITSSNAVGGELTLPFTYQITASSTPTSYSLSGTLPTGLEFTEATGTISGIPEEQGIFPLTMGVANSAGSDSAPLTITVTALQPPVITSASTAAGALQLEFHYQITASRPPLSYQLDGVLPDGVTFDSGTGLISGTPLNVGVYPVTVSATNQAGTGSASLTITVTELPPPTITSETFAPAQVGVPFSYQITAMGDPMAFGLDGALPTGLTFDEGSGEIAGTPEIEGQFTVTISATNPFGTTYQELRIDVAPHVLDLTEALDQPDLIWTTSGEKAWVPVTNVSHDGVDSAAITGLHNEQSGALSTQVEGPASLRFFWKVSSEEQYDYLSFQLDGEERFRISGEVDWQVVSVPIPAGLHEIRFIYRKDAYVMAGEDAAWVDQVVLLPREGHSGSDSFAGAQALTGAHVSIHTSNVDATIEPDEVSPLPGSVSHSLWWSWTAPETGTVVMSTNGSTFDTVLAVYTGTELGSLKLVSFSDDISRMNHASQVTFEATARETYFITIAGYSTASGNVKFSLHYQRTGDYVGIGLTESPANTIASELRLRLTRKLAYTGKVYFRGRRYPIRGSLDAGSEIQSINRGKGVAPLNLTLATDLPTGVDAISGTLHEGFETYRFTARRRIYQRDLSPLAAGGYNLLFESSSLGTTVSHGSGYGRAVVSKRGDVRFSGAFGDGQRVSQGSVLTARNIWPCFAPYRGKLGTVAGEATFDAVGSKNFGGSLRWRVENGIATFSDVINLTGCYHYPPTLEYPTLAVSSGTQNVQLMFSHRNPAADPGDPLFTFSPVNQFKGLPPGYRMTVNPRNGLISGSLIDTITGRRQPFAGIILEVENRGGGYFKSSAGAGRFDLVVR